MLRAVSKFGGSSVADAACVSRVVSLIKAPPADRSRQHVVVSAPGKRTPADVKVTDLLLQAHGHAQAKSRPEYDTAMATITARFMELSPGLASLQTGLDAAARDIYDHPELDTGFAASRGEYLNGLVVAHQTGMEFVDPADDFIVFGDDKKLDAERTTAAVRRRVACQAGAPGFVIPGFFGGVGGKATPAALATFSRGGSDVTASLVAAALMHDLRLQGGEGSGFGGVVHENFTDVDGVFSTDPRLCPTARSMPRLSYAQTHALALAGAGVLHPDAVTPLAALGVPIHVRSTWQADGQGTWISAVGAEGNYDHGASATSATTTEAEVRALGRATALAVAGSGARVTVVCKEVAEPALGKRAVEARLAAALGAHGLAFTLPSSSSSSASSSGLTAAVDLADPSQLSAAVEIVFDDLLKP